MLVFKIKH